MQSFRADVLMYDAAMVGALLVHEQNGPPSLAVGVLPMLMSSVDTAPFGLGLQPSTNPFRRIRNRLLNWFVQNVAFRDVQAHWQAMRAPSDGPDRLVAESRDAVDVLLAAVGAGLRVRAQRPRP
jgi:hypothetical protein